MVYFIRGKGKVTLTQNDFIFQGGEGKVFGLGDTAFKIYDNIKHLIPEAKIKELKAIDHPRVIKPHEILLDSKGSPVGFTMDWIKQSIGLPRLFTSDFRNKNGITDNDTIELIESLIEMIIRVHEAGCLMVDGNEFNYLVDDITYKIPYCIDVNTYQTKSFPATAIMPSIRDYHSKKFTKLTDWFSFAIVAFQLFTGIHPYKGRHPEYSRKKMGTDLLKNRMTDNISVFDQQVTLPPSVRDLKTIPSNFHDWFVDLFKFGRRKPPPTKPGVTVTASVGVKMIPSTNTFMIRKLKTFPDNIIDCRVVFGKQIIRTAEKIFIDDKPYPADTGTDVVLTPINTTAVFIRIKNNRAEFTCPTKKILAPDIACSHLMLIENTPYLINRGSIMELVIKERPDENIIAALGATWPIMPNSSDVFDRVVYQSILGKPYLVMPVPKKNGSGSCALVFISEIQGYRVVNARRRNRICMVTGYKNGTYYRFVFKFNDSYEKYECRKISDIHPAALNFVVLDHHVVVCNNEDNAIELFSENIDNQRVDIIKDAEIDPDMVLCKEGVMTQFFRGCELYSIRMK